MMGRPGLVAIACCMVACSTRQPVSAFQRHLSTGRWEEAAAVFARDTAFFSDADAVFEAAMLHGAPARVTYDPQRAAALLERFVERFPTDQRRGQAIQHLALLNEIVALRTELRALKAIDLGRQPKD